MANPYRGEVTLEIDGVPRVLRLTLGRLAVLEAELGAGSLVSLVERFEGDAFGASDILALLSAGSGLPRQEIADAEIAGGPVAAAKAAAELLRLTFALPTGPGAP